MSRVSGLRRLRLVGRDMVRAVASEDQWILEAPLSQLLVDGVEAL